MAGEGLALEVDRTEVTVGESLHGTVRAVADLPEVRKLTVFFECQGANISPQRWSETELQVGPLRAGQRWIFELPLPEHAPFTFEDEGHDLTWHVMAHGDVSWIKAEVSKVPLRVRPRRIAATDAVLATLAPAPEPENEPTGLVGTVLLTLLGVVLVFAVLPLAPLLLIFIANSRIQHTRLTDFELKIPERGLALGEWVPVTLRFRLKRPVDVASLKLTIDGTKRWRSGDNSRSHTFHEQTFDLVEDCIMAPREPGGREGGGAYRSRSKVAGDPGLCEWIVPVKLPEDGWPVVPQRISYHAKAVMKVRGWPDPTATAELPVVSTVVEGPTPAPEPPSVEETSPGVAIVGPGAAPPPGVDLTIAADRIWPWVAMPTLGAAIIVVTVAAGLTEPDAPWPALVALITLGLVGTGYGLWGFYQRLYR